MTPLQMAEVAAAVANGGELMEPRLWSKVIDPDGRETELDPDRQSRVMSEDTANTLTEMMTDVVNEGTGGCRRPRRSTSPARPAPPRSTSPGDQPGLVHRLRPADDPEIAVAATVERTTGSAAKSPRRSPSR